MLNIEDTDNLNEVWGSQGGDKEVCYLLGYDVMFWILTF